MTAYVVILNTNTWGDTIECLESVFRSTCDDYRVIVCDNNSANGSLDCIAAWADGCLDALPDQPGELRLFSFPPVAKPVPYHRLSREEAENCEPGYAADRRLVLIQNGGNLGFAGGHNVGLRYALRQADFAYAWLLNNDTVIEPGALTALVARMRERPDAGQCGSTVMYYYRPDVIQTLAGASFNRWLCRPMLLNKQLSADQDDNVLKVEAALDFINGASLFVTADFIRDIGLMYEGYFLFYEEIDWARRAGSRFALAYAPGSLVYHKHGGSSGSSPKTGEISAFAERHYLRSKFRFALRHAPLVLPLVYVSFLWNLMVRLFQGRWDRARLILGILARPHSSPPAKPESRTPC